MYRSLRIAAAAIGLSSLAHAQTVPLPDYAEQFREYAGSLQPEGGDGWDLFRRIGAVHQEIVEAHDDGRYALHTHGLVDYGLLWDTRNFDRLGEGYTLESQVPRIEAQIADLRASGVLDRLAELAAMQRLTQPERDETIPESDGSLINLLLPQLGESRALARLNCARIVLSQSDDETAAAFAQNVWLARHVPRSAPLLITGLAGRAVEAITLARIRDALLEGTIDPNLAGRLLRTLDDAPPMLTTRRILEAERLFRLDTINRLYTDDGRGDGRLVPARLDGLSGESGDEDESFDAPAVGEGSRTFATKQQVLDRDREVHGDLIELALATPQERRGLNDALNDTFSDAPKSNARGQANLLLGMLTPAVARAADAEDHYRLDAAGTRIMLAIEVYRQREGRLPETLDALVPDTLPEMPLDPFTRETLIYRPDAESPLGYVLYSPGFDQRDDAGTPYKRAGYPLGALRWDGEGSDYIFVGSE